jgi:hypothetical protein
MRGWFALFLVPLVACAASVPDPREAALAYARAAETGDGDAVYEMLSDESKRRYTESEVRALVADEKAELRLQAEAVRAATKVVTEASVPYADGEEAALILEGGAFRISAADALPADSRTVVQALGQLRKVLARRSYQGLLRVLTPRSRAAMEEDLRSLVIGLEQPEGLDVELSGETATVVLPGGHLVKLRKEAGVWRVEDFD